MPALLTHQYFATRMIRPFLTLFPFLDKQNKAVFLGAQGPDPFFFYGHALLRSRKNTKAINAFGNQLHNDSPIQTLGRLLLQLHEQKDEAVLAYIFGALTHYVLDRTVHPYVFYHTGFDASGGLTPPYSFAHARFEVAIDVAVIQYFQLDRQVYHPRSTLSLDKQARQAISQMYHQVYPLQVSSDHFFDATEDMQAILALLFHASRLRRCWISLIAGKQSLPVSLMHPNKIDKPMVEALLNHHRLPWYHPVTNVKHDESVLMLFEQAEKLLLAFKPYLTAMIAGKIIATSEFEALFSNIDYDGKPLTETMRFYKSFY
jgi:hypothetical protein